MTRFGCEPGPFCVRTMFDGYAPSVFFLTAPAEPSPTPLQLELPKLHGSVTGRVLHADGSPFARTPLYLYRVAPEGLIDATAANVASSLEGEFETPPLARGEHVIVAAGGPQEAPGTARFEIGDPAVTVTVSTASGIATEFRVVAATRSAKPGDTEYRILDPDGVPLVDTRLNWGSKPAPFDQFSVVLRRGRYTVVVWRGGYRERRVLFDVPSGGPVDVPLELDEPKPR